MVKWNQKRRRIEIKLLADEHRRMSAQSTTNSKHIASHNAADLMKIVDRSSTSFASRVISNSPGTPIME